MNKNVVAAAVLALCCAPSYASLISTDLTASGDGLLTYDTDTNLEWLDITQTAGISYNDILANTTGLFDLGFGLAVRDQIDQLFLNAGVAALGTPRSEANTPGVELLIDRLGCNLCFVGSNLRGGSVFFYDPIAAAEGGAGHATYTIDVYNQGFAYAGGTLNQFYLDTPATNLSTFLVRTRPTSVPEPGGLALFAAGLLGLFASRHMRAHTAKG